MPHASITTPPQPLPRRGDRHAVAVAVAHAIAIATALGALLLAGCAPLPQRAGIPTRWVPSPNHNARSVQLVVLHYTAGDASGRALRTLIRDGSGVSAHYLIERDGAILQLVDERARAWHAGDSRWGATVDVNSASIGIELDNDGAEPYPSAQIDALLRLLADIRSRHGVPAANVVGHADVAPARKVDPGPHFPWRTLAAHGFGLWCEPPLAPAPPLLDPWLGLRAIGYDTRRPDATLRAFRLHHRPGTPVDASIDDTDQALIACLAGTTVAVP